MQDTYLWLFRVLVRANTAPQTQLSSNVTEFLGCQYFTKYTPGSRSGPHQFCGVLASDRLHLCTSKPGIDTCQLRGVSNLCWCQVLSYNLGWNRRTTGNIMFHVFPGYIECFVTNYHCLCSVRLYDYQPLLCHQTPGNSRTWWVERAELRRRAVSLDGSEAGFG